MKARSIFAFLVPALVACSEPPPLPPPPAPADAPPPPPGWGGTQPPPATAAPPPGATQAGQAPPPAGTEPPGAVCSLDDPKSCPAGKTCSVPPGSPTRTGNCK
ncbi:MAG TPA: hypothetical protein VFS43_16570 [Polyangiaceae bacterium]|nr:hypothetical protein [Polyangiaceae bacterium]